MKDAVRVWMSPPGNHKRMPDSYLSRKNSEAPVCTSRRGEKDYSDVFADSCLGHFPSLLFLSTIEGYRHYYNMWKLWCFWQLAVLYGIFDQCNIQWVNINLEAQGGRKQGHPAAIWNVDVDFAFILNYCIEVELLQESSMKQAFFSLTSDCSGQHQGIAYGINNILFSYFSVEVLVYHCKCYLVSRGSNKSKCVCSFLFWLQNNWEPCMFSPFAIPQNATPSGSSLICVSVAIL